MRHLAVAFAALLAVLTALWHLRAATDGLEVIQTRAGTLPVTIYRPAAGRPAPLVVIAHGFAGSQQLMQPFATTLARNGYVALTFDFPGHGQNPQALPGRFEDHAALSKSLDGALAAAVAYGRGLPGVDGRYAVLGHSMASTVVAGYAQQHPEVEATVAVSLFLPGATATSPRNLLIIDGALEPSMLINEATRIVALATAGPVQAGTTYGSFTAGSARRLALAPGVEHIGVLYSGRSLTEALDWLNQAFGRRQADFLDTRGAWLGLLFLGLVALAWPLARCLPRLVEAPVANGYRWRDLLLLAGAPALLTPLLLWKVPTDFLPIMLGDYLVLHFGLYGLLTLAGMALHRRRHAVPAQPAPATAKLLLATLAVAAYGIFAVGMATHVFVFNFMPGPGRIPLVFALLAGTLVYFVSDEWLVRAGKAVPGAYAFTKFCFLLSLVLAIALNPGRLFFLAIIVPMILLFFSVFGLFSAWAYRRTGTPLVGGLANAWVFAWAIAVTFPVVGGHLP
jgi:dienelactone hydrolase